MILLVCTKAKHFPQRIAIMIQATQDIVQKSTPAPGGTLIATGPTSMVGI